MKKLLFLAGLALAFIGAASLPALDYNAGDPPYVSQYGSKMKPGSGVFAGGPKDAACIYAELATTLVNVTAGDAVVYVATTSLSVSKTATAGDPAFYGIALTTATFGNEVQICRLGKVKARSAINVTQGMKLITAASAGKLTAVAAVTETLFTGVSGTAIAGRAAEARTVTLGDGQVLITTPF